MYKSSLSRHRSAGLVPFSYELLERRFNSEASHKTASRIDEDTGEGQAIRCDTCLATITYPGNQLERLGRHVHTFRNPSGLSFTIACYARAWCDAVGKPTEAWSWFPAYRWQYALCHECHEHLGWFYRSHGGLAPFYGLILQRLIFDAEA